MYIICTNGTPTVNMLDHLPPLPLFVDCGHTSLTLTVQDELGIYHALRLHDRVYHINLNLSPSILRKVIALMDQHFPILEHLSLSSTATTPPPLTLPEAFLAPKLRHLALPSIRPLRRLQLLTSIVSLVTLELGNIETSSYFNPSLLVERLLFLPQLRKLSIAFSTLIPHPSTESELSGEQGVPVTLPSLKILQFKGVGAYLESLLAQIKVPLLERLCISLFHETIFALPHLSYLINITEAFKLPKAAVGFDRNEVYVTALHYNSEWFEWGPFLFRVICKPLDWKIDRAAQICSALIPTLSCVEQLTLYHNYREITTELRSGAINSARWHDLLRSFIGIKRLYIDITLDNALLEELSHALQLDEVGSDPGFLPNLLFIIARGPRSRSISARHDLFTSFIHTRQVVARPIQVSSW